MTPVEWIGTGVLDFVCSLVAFVVVLHFDLEGWWQQRHVAREAKRRPLPPTPSSDTCYACHGRRFVVVGGSLYAGERLFRPCPVCQPGDV